ncbi:hypothetical protein [Piscinibacter sp.]|uniref:hypothetical protein n=1 Tax=Piscinibacter sp. TaxID=1903157 RepID=UPI002ED35B3E
MRTIPSAGVAQFRSSTTGVDGVQLPELSPTLAKADLQDGPRAEAATTLAKPRIARNRMVNRSIAKARGPGEFALEVERAQGGDALRRSFDGLTMRDSRLADGGNAFSVEPPDQGLCVGNGFVVESVNDAIRVFDRRGNPLTGVTSLNTFYGYAPAIDRTTLTFGPSLTDPSCYYDPSTRRFFHVILTIEVEPATGDFTGVNHLDLAVSTSDDPRGSWTIYRIPVQDDGTQGTPAHANCPCLGDYPHIGVDAHGVYLTTNEFPFSGGFNSAQLYALSKKDLVGGAVSVTLVQIDTLDHLLDGNPGFTVWPAVSPAGDFSRENRGTEYLMSSVAVFNDSGTDNRLRVWAIGNTRSLDTNSPDLTVTDTTVRVHRYSVPPPATQKSGPTPLADCLNDDSLVTPFGTGCWTVFFDEKPPPAVAPEPVDSNDSRMQQVFYTGGRLYGALDTAVQVGGEQRAGIAYFAVRPFSFFGSLFALLDMQGRIAVRGNDVTYPAIAALADGRGIIAFTLLGRDEFPSAAFVQLGRFGHQGPVRTAAAGKGPDDGFSGYAAFDGDVARWGDYGAAAVDGDDFWIASEYIGQTCTFAEYANFSAFGSCGGTRISLGNWYTRISRVRP